jgi:tetratricopeptide (TPR) repeat protein
VITLLAGLLLQTPACDRMTAAAAVDSAWNAYRRGELAEATSRFAAADSTCRPFPAAQAGLGFIALRSGDNASADRHFTAALRSDSLHGDAWYGLGLARERLGRHAPAIVAWRRALAVTPTYVEALDALLAAGVDSGLPLEPPPRPTAPQVPARAVGEMFEIRANSAWQPFYVKGINLGAALPGRFPADFPEDDATYARWLELIAAANANVVRLYTILPPAFYRELKRWNAAHPDRPLWLVHGVWAELPRRGDYDAPEWKGSFRAEIRRVVDVVHGRAAIGRRRGHAWGRYDADVSDHVLAYIIGREWEPFSIRAYNKLRSGARATAYAGRFLAVDSGTPADVWMAEQCDYMLGYEWDIWHAARPIAYTNWPTLDPLHHPTEATAVEEQALRRRLGLPRNVRLKEYDNDGESLDAMLVRPTGANVAGYFASYHAYPYYPDFIGLDSAYGAVRSSLGPSHYFGYLRDLKRHHAGRALLIAEYGLPSSRGVAHLDPEGMHHGGHDERDMAERDVRLTREIREAGLAGGILFAWLDEWFKHNWVAIDVEVPPERTRLWHNVMDAEQHYGLLGLYAGGTTRPEPGGDAARWRALDLVAESTGTGLRAGADPSYLYLTLESPLAMDSVSWTVGIDTHRPDRGQFALPGGPDDLPTGVEFALVLRDTANAQLLVTPSYNPYLGPRPGMQPTDLDAFYDTRATIDRRLTDGRFDSLFVATNRFRVARSGTAYPARGVNRGRLRYGRASESTLADWFVDPRSGLVEVRLPWGLLNVTDPSSRTVLARVRDPGPFRVEVTDGFRFVVYALARDGSVRARAASRRPYSWPTWETPVWHERLKPAYYAMQALWGSW